MRQNEKTLKLAKSALCFKDIASETSVQFSEGEEGLSKLDMLVYSGKPILNHWYWGNVAFDLSGMSASKGYPILEDHYTSKKIGFSKGKPLIENNELRVDPNTTVFVDTPESVEFRKLSKQGFPYQASVYGVPSIIERLDENEEVEVNGYKLKGPGSVWRKWEFKEASVCVFGRDSNTKSEAMSNEGDLEFKFTELHGGTVEEENNEKEEESMKTLEEFKTQHPDLFNQFSEELKAEMKKDTDEMVQAKLNEQKEILMKQFSQEKDALADRVLEMEKKDALRTEKEIQFRADSIWETKLRDSDIPEHLFAKVSKHVPYARHMKDGVLDEKAFTEAIDEEIKDWETKGVTSSVMGMGFTTKDTVDPGAMTETKENEECLGLLDSFVSQPAQ